MRKNANRSLLLALVATLMPACFAFASEGPRVPQSLPVGVSEVLGLAGSLVLVVGAVIVVGWLYSKSQGIRGAASDVINVVAAQALGPKERIVLVDVGGTQIVLGMTAQQMQTLHVFDEPIVAAERSNAPVSAFAAKLKVAVRGVAK